MKIIRIIPMYSILIMVILLLLSPLHASAITKSSFLSKEISGDMVYTAAELIDWLHSNPKGGEVSLGKNIHLNQGFTMKSASRIIINMNGYGFYSLGGNAIDINGSFVFRSNNSSVPVFTLGPETPMYFSPDVYIDVVNGCGIYFTGDTQPDSVRSYSSFFSHISASGSQAVGIKCDGNLSVETLNITLSKGAWAVESSGDVSLFLVGIIGNGTAIRTNGRITLDSCGLPSIPPNASIISRTPYLTNSANFICNPFPQEDFPAFLPSLISYTFKANNPIYPDRTVFSPVHWNMDKIDSKKPGIYELESLEEPFPIYGMNFEIPNIQGSLLITTPGNHYLASALAESNRTILYFHSQPDRDISLTLYYSINDGKEWNVFENCYFSYPTSIYLEDKLDKEVTYLFQADITDDGVTSRTNILQISFGENGNARPLAKNGDRDGSDRDDQPIPPNTTEVPATETPSLEDESHATSNTEKISSPVTPPSSSNQHTGQPETEKFSAPSPPDRIHSSNNTRESSIDKIYSSDSIREAESSYQTEPEWYQTPPPLSSYQYIQPEQSYSGRSQSKSSALDITGTGSSSSASSIPGATAQGTSSLSQSKNTSPMPVSQSGHALPKILLLSAVIILTCFLLYWRNKKNS